MNCVRFYQFFGPKKLIKANCEVLISNEPLVKPLGAKGMMLGFPKTKVLFKFMEIVPNERNSIVCVFCKNL